MSVKLASLQDCERLFRERVEPDRRPFDRRRFDRYSKKHRTPRAAISFVQEKDGNFNSTSGTATFTTAVTAGDTLFCLVNPINTTSAAFTLSVADSLNGTWNSAGSFFSAFESQAQLFYFLNSAAGNPTITITTSTSGVVAWAIAEYKNIAAIDVTPTATSTTTGASFPCPNVTTTMPGDLILCALAYGGNPGTTTVSSPYTLRVTTQTNGTMFGEQIASSATLYTGATFSITFSGSAGYGITSSWKAVNASMAFGDDSFGVMPCAGFDQNVTVF